MSALTVDLLPRILLHTSAGVVVIGPIDPSSPLAGTVTFPVVGAVPYSAIYGLPESTVTLHFALGDVPIPLNPFGGGSGGVVALPMLGDVPYELVLGPPQIAESDVFGAGMLSSLSVYVVPIALGLAALWLWRR